MRNKVQSLILLFLVLLSSNEISGQINHVKKSIRQESFIWGSPDIMKFFINEELFDYENFVLKQSKHIESSYISGDTNYVSKQKYIKKSNYFGTFSSEQIIEYPLSVFKCNAHFSSDSSYNSVVFSTKNKDDTDFSTTKTQTFSFDSNGDLVEMQQATPLSVFSGVPSKTISKIDKTSTLNRKYVEEIFELSYKMIGSSTIFNNIFFDQKNKILNLDIARNFSNSNLNSEISKYHFKLDGTLDSINIFNVNDSKNELTTSFKFESDSSKRTIQIHEENTFEERNINFEYLNESNAYSENICLNERGDFVWIDWSLDMNIDTKVLLIDKNNLNIIYYNVFPIGKPYFKHTNLPKGEYFVIVMCDHYFGFKLGVMTNYLKI